MARRLLYYITDRKAFPGDEPARQRALLDKIAEAARAGVDYIQLREKDLTTQELEELAREAVHIVRENPQLRTAILVNSRTDVALAAGTDGVHLRSDDIATEEVRQIWQCGAGVPPANSGQAPALEVPPHNPIIGVSCHSPEEVVQAAAQNATFAVFAPVFWKKDEPHTPPAGLAAVRESCRAKIPVLALGGITLENAHSCLEAGASGIAGIRLFQENNIDTVVTCLRLQNS